MGRLPEQADDPRGIAKARRRVNGSSSGKRVESVRQGASGAAVVAVGGSSYLFRLDQAETLGLSPVSLAAGVDLDEGEILLLSLAAESYEAEKRAGALLARAEQSSRILALKLEKKGYSKKAIRIALERLTLEGSLSDSRFAEAYVVSRLSRRAEGPASLVAALRERGIDGDTAKTAVSVVLGPEERASALAKAATKELRRSGSDKGEVRRRLHALGFKSEEISDFFDATDSEPGPS
jgi:regulatory protein